MDQASQWETDMSGLTRHFKWKGIQSVACVNRRCISISQADTGKADLFHHASATVNTLLWVDGDEHLSLILGLENGGVGRWFPLFDSQCNDTQVQRIHMHATLSFFLTLSQQIGWVDPILHPDGDAVVFCVIQRDALLVMKVHHTVACALEGELLSTKQLCSSCLTSNIKVPALSFH